MLTVLNHFVRRNTNDLARSVDGTDFPKSTVSCQPNKVTTVQIEYLYSGYKPVDPSNIGTALRDVKHRW